MKKLSKFTMFLYAYFFICIIHSTYSFYVYGKDFFTRDKKEVAKTDTLTNVIKDTIVNTEKELNPISKTPIGSFQYKFLKNSNIIPIVDEIVLNDQEFKEYKKEYNYYLNKYFTSNQLKGIKEIVIADAEMFDDGSSGITESINQNSYILMACKANDSTVIIHEACHAFHAYYIGVFDRLYKDKWLKCNKYVSEYAKTNIYEDFAETGTAYLLGDTLTYNPKFKLFADFYKQTKK